MAYFDEIKVGDKVWDFVNLWGKVIEIRPYYVKQEIVVDFDNGAVNVFDFNGKPLYGLDPINQTLFWDEVKFETPKKPKIELKNDYSEYFDDDNHGNTHSFDQIKRFAKLLALRDQECYDSRGFIPRESDKYYYIYFNNDLQENIVGEVSTKVVWYSIPFKTKKDAQKICDILNSGRFDLKG